MSITRRDMMKSTAAVGVATLMTGASAALAQNEPPAPAGAAAADSADKKPRIRQSVCEWCFNKHWKEKEEFCANAGRLGLVGVDLVTPDWFETLKKHNLISTMTRTHGIEKGLNRKENWEPCLKSIRDAIDANAAAGYPNVITFSGNRAGMSDEEGLKNCAEALKQIVGHAEEKKVTICMELLNSKQHRDYMCDHTKWGVDLCKAVGSERFKLLYDIYHMQIMEGDIIATIKANKDYLGHYHTAGVPGRHELDENQELQYEPIMRAIADTGFKGIVAQEFTPTKGAYASLEHAVKICDV
ncbi:MAG: hydroxypyruvate isomerase [Humisphaera sp.]|nr:hydroxypyruvate isomerase [Humisphaera sp.]